MQVLALVQPKVQVAHRGAGERFEENRRELDVPAAELGLRQREFPDEKGAAREIDRRGDQRLVHGEGRPAVANEALLVADGLENRFPEDDPEIFGGVVAVDLDVAHRTNRQRSTRPWRAICSTMCERNGSGVCTSALPDPSRSSSTMMSVSRVFRETWRCCSRARP